MTQSLLNDEHNNIHDDNNNIDNNHDDIHNNHVTLCNNTTVHNINYNNNNSLIYKYIKYIHLPIMLHPIVQCIIILVSIIFTIYAICYTIQYIDLGLDQSVVLPQDSYLQSYFNDLKQYVRVGPPLYIVVETPPVEQLYSQYFDSTQYNMLSHDDNNNSNNNNNMTLTTYTDTSQSVSILDSIDWSDINQQNLICSISGCNNNSLGSYILQQSYDIDNTISNGVSNCML